MTSTPHTSEHDETTQLPQVPEEEIPETAELPTHVEEAVTQTLPVASQADGVEEQTPSVQAWNSGSLPNTQTAANTEASWDGKAAWSASSAWPAVPPQAQVPPEGSMPQHQPQFFTGEATLQAQPQAHSEGALPQPHASTEKEAAHPQIPTEGVAPQAAIPPLSPAPQAVWSFNSLEEAPARGVRVGQMIWACIVAFTGILLLSLPLLRLVQPQVDMALVAISLVAVLGVTLIITALMTGKKTPPAQQ